MALSLLGRLYSHIRGSQEDVATLSLQYIVSQSPALTAAFSRLLTSSLSCAEADLHFICQASGEDRERPDIAGLDLTGKELLLCEAKFYAGLTDNQPNRYLDRLADENGLGLVFLCPAARRINLWSQLLPLCGNRSVEPLSDFCVSVGGIRMSILTWSEVIETIRTTASAYAAHTLSDIDQLDGFCRQMDTEAFIPFTSEDFGPIVARREDRYYQVIDAVIDALHADKTLNTSLKGLRATGHRKGYTRSILISGHGVTISYDRDLWTDPSTCETPFWVSVRDEHWKQPQSYAKSFLRLPESERNGIWLALHPLKNTVLDNVAQDIKRQIKEYIRLVDTETAQ